MSETTGEGEHNKPDWRLALAITFLFAWMNYGLSHTAPGRWLEFKAYGLLNTALSDLGRDFPIVNVDIGAIPSDPRAPTSRKALTSILEQVFDRPDEEQPAAIGIDIDFSPMLNERVSQEDQEFFGLCSRISSGIHPSGAVRKKVPVYLGIGRTAYNSPDEWLGYHDFIGLAANIRVDPDDTHQTSRWTLDPAGHLYGETKRLVSMGQALAQAHADSHKNSLPGPGRLAFCLDTIPLDPGSSEASTVGGEEEEIGVTLNRPDIAKNGTAKDDQIHTVLTEGRSLVNYSKLDQMREQPVRIEMRGGTPVVSGDFAGKIVLLGDTEARDVFTIPGPIKPVKGVYLHASAAYTFLREPLYNLKHIWRFGLDVLLSVALVLVLALVDAKTRNNAHRNAFRGGAHMAMLATVAAGGLILVRFTGIMWFDFIAIVIALAVHPKIEHVLAAWWKQRRTRRSALQNDGVQTDAPFGGES